MISLGLCQGKNEPAFSRHVCACLVFVFTEARFAVPGSASLLQTRLCDLESLVLPLQEPGDWAGSFLVPCGRMQTCALLLPLRGMPSQAEMLDLSEFIYSCPFPQPWLSQLIMQLIMQQGSGNLQNGPASALSPHGKKRTHWQQKVHTGMFPSALPLLHSCSTVALQEGKDHRILEG